MATNHVATTMKAITVKAAQKAVEVAQYAYVHADVNHPTQIITTKQTLNSARQEYLNACAAFCTKLEFATDLAEVHHQLIEQGIWP